MVRKPKPKSPAIERDPNPFMRIAGPFADDVMPVRERRFMELADIALGTKSPEPRRNKRRHLKSV